MLFLSAGSVLMLISRHCHILMTRRGVWIHIAFTVFDSSNSQLQIINSFMDLHNLRISVADAKSQSVIVFTGCCLVTASNNRNTSASVLTSLLDDH
jgi:hypothetical protein